MTLEEAKDRARKWHKGFGGNYAVREFWHMTDIVDGYHVLCLGTGDRMEQVYLENCKIVWCIVSGGSRNVAV